LNSGKLTTYRIAMTVQFTLLWCGGDRCAFAQADTATSGANPILVLDANGHTGSANRLLYWPYRNELISVSHDKTIRFWDVDTGEPTRVLRPPIDRGDAGRLWAAALSPDNQLLAVGGESALRKPEDHAVYLIDPVEGRVGELSGNSWRPNVGRSSLIPSIPFSKP
jgi:WD40 repeat protein